MAENDPNALLLLGEIRGQLRELVHTSNNNGTKLDALGIRVAALEADQNRREGERGVFQSLLRSPVIAWIVAIGVLIAGFVARENRL